MMEVDARWRDDIGYMLDPRKGRRIALSWVPFAVDNGRFSKTFVFDPVWWEADLYRIARRTAWAENCLFVVAPDTVGDPHATLREGLHYLPVIHQTGLRSAFVSQDGATEQMIPWDQFDVLFVGGSDAWKDSTASWRLCDIAREQYGKRVHVGRVNGLKRLQACADHHVDSVDGTMLNFHPARMWDKLVHMLDVVNEPIERKGR